MKRQFLFEFILRSLEKMSDGGVKRDREEGAPAPADVPGPATDAADATQAAPASDAVRDTKRTRKEEGGAGGTPAAPSA